MRLALYGSDGRSAATHSALALGFALAVGGRPVTLLRIAEPPHGLARVRETMPETLRIVEGRLSPGRSLADRLAELLGDADGGGRAVILDLPLARVAERDLAAFADLSVVAVGPGPLDERLAASAVGRLAADGPLGPLWLLGLGRSGGDPDARRFEGSMRALLEREDPGALAACRFLPVALPAASRPEAEACANGSPTASTLRDGILLLAAVEVAASDPDAAEIDRNAFAEALGLGDATLVTADRRRLSERLRDLADDLEALEREGPRPGDLADAPLMDGWSFGSGRTRVVTGRCFGHPSIPGGRAAATSDVFATDGRTWARTLSRLYRLGTPAVAMPNGGLQ